MSESANSERSGDRSSSLVSQDELDRLATGELSKAEQRDLVARLDSESDGWRRCTLALLEAQAWRRSLGQFVAHESDVRSDGVGLARQSERAGLRWTGLTAALAIALAAGVGLGRSWPAESATGLANRGSTLADAKEPTPSPTAGGSGQLELPSTGRDDLPVRLVGHARFNDGSSGESTLPVVSGPGVDGGWLENRPALVSEYERQQLLRQGLRVFEQRQSVTVQLESGQKFSIPMDQVRYQVIPQRVY